MPFQNITPQEAYQKMQEEGFAYVDVRTPEEFQAGRPQGAVNIPIFFKDVTGMKMNADFLTQVREHFANDAKLVIGCQAGGRSAQACALLDREGFQSLFNVDGGFGGRQDPTTGMIVQPGWEEEGLPVAR